MKRSMELLPQVPFSILIALSLKPRHGYEIMKQIEEDSLGKVKLAPGGLYTTIKLLRKEGLVEEVEADQSNQRTRRYYALTPKGWERLNLELAYFDNIVKIAKDRTTLEGLDGRAAG